MKLFYTILYNKAEAFKDLLEISLRTYLICYFCDDRETGPFLYQGINTI